MAQRISIAPWIAGVGLSLAACSGNNAPLPAPGDEPVFPNAPSEPFPPSMTPGSPSLSGPAKSLQTPPAPLSGGTLLVLRDGRTAVASDPDRDMIFVADIKDKKLLASIPTKEGSQPGRAIEDSQGNVHVVLRESGEVVSLKAGAWSVQGRQQVCPAPRGIAFDGSRIWVACAGGELVQATTASDRKQFKIDRDLRDVVWTNGRLLVTQFRSAQVLTVSPETGEVLSRSAPPGSKASQQPSFMKRPDPTAGPESLRAAEPTVAWRMRGLPGGGAVVLHQEASTGELGLESGGYGGGPCKGAVGAAVTTVGKDGSITTSGHIMSATLPIDIDVAADGRHIAMIMAGNIGESAQGPSVALMTTTSMNTEGCSFPSTSVPSTGSGGVPGTEPSGTGGSGGMSPGEEALPAPDVISADFSNKQPVAVAFDRLGHVIVQSREPAVLMILGKQNAEISLSKISKEDSGQRVFHMTTRSGLACASCHPEGGDDGRVWAFQKIGARRTQNLRGGIVNTAPFHWDGDMRDLGTLMTEVFGGRMQGPVVDGPHLKALAHFMDSIKDVPATGAADSAAATRGRALFNDSKVGCATCHSGPALSNNATVDVGTGRAVQVPGLRGVGSRAPFMHNGCAKTLKDRFDPKCGGGDKHGVTSHLSADQIGDLTAFMETL